MDDAIQMLIDLERDPPSAGRTLVTLLEHDRVGTLARIDRLGGDDQLLLAEAYLAHYKAHPWHSAECICRYWRACAARHARGA